MPELGKIDRDFFGIDPLISISEGRVLAAVDPPGVDDVIDALAAEDIPAADVGEVTEGSGLVVDGESTDHPGADPFWVAMAEHMERLQAQ